MNAPQRKNPGQGHPTSPEVRAMRAELARAQHAAKRGYEIRPEDRKAYHNRFRVLRKHGLSRDEAAAELRTEFATPHDQNA